MTLTSVISPITITCLICGYNFTTKCAQTAVYLFVQCHFKRELATSIFPNIHNAHAPKSESPCLQSAQYFTTYRLQGRQPQIWPRINGDPPHENLRCAMTSQLSLWFRGVIPAKVELPYIHVQS